MTLPVAGDLCFYTAAAAAPQGCAWHPAHLPEALAGAHSKCLMARNAYFHLQGLLFPFQLLDSLHAFLLAGPGGMGAAGGAEPAAPAPTVTVSLAGWSPLSFLMFSVTIRWLTVKINVPEGNFIYFFSCAGRHCSQYPRQ